ncbi:MAG TPA: hypothetical protein VIJ36_03575, partial [Thermoanaerobaculia bacterium]
VWARLLMYLAPSISLAITAGMVWLVDLFDEYLANKRNLIKYHYALSIADEVLNNENSGPAEKEEARRLREAATKNRLSFAHQQLVTK